MLRRVGLLGALLVVVIATAPVGAPVQLSYVYSDSMEPTLDANDGYILVPAGDVQRGDIVTFRSPERDAYVTHRVAGETDGRFVTKGDNNPTTDQATGYSPVSREQIQGKVLTLGGEPVVIPSLGSAISWLRSNVPALGALAVAVFAYTLFAGSSDRPRRELLQVGEIASLLFLIAALSTVAVLAYGGTGHTLTYVAVDSASAASGPSTMAVGSSKPVTLVVNQSVSPLTTRVVSVDGVDVANTTRTATNLSVAGTVPPPTDIGPVPVTVSVTRYPAVLPTSVLQWLSAWHPLAAATATAGTVFAPMWLVYGLLFDGAEPIRRSRSRLWRILAGGFE